MFFSGTLIKWLCLKTCMLGISFSTQMAVERRLYNLLNFFFFGDGDFVHREGFKGFLFTLIDMQNKF